MKNDNKIIGKNRIYFNKINSTQIKAKELAEEGIENGSIVITDNQTNGIGTHDRKWYTSESKNLTFSMILYPECEIEELNSLTIDIANMINTAIYKLYGYKLGIKKPNDIVYNDKKIGGILTQITTKGRKIKYLIIGIGININQTEFNDEIKNIATSLKNEFKREFDRYEILDKILIEFEKYFLDNKII